MVTKLYEKLLGLGKGTKKIEWIVPYAKGYRVLDLGCVQAEGAYLTNNWLHAHLSSEAHYCLGLDLDENSIGKIKSLGYNVICGDAQDFALKDSFDVVVAADILEHLHDWRGFFTSIGGALKENGLLIITIPNPWFFLRFIRCILKGDAGSHPEHVAWFCQYTIEELLRRYGFSVERIEYGSSEPKLYRLYFLPESLRHTSIFVAAKKNL